MSRSSHVYLVKTLYRRILTLHRTLPITLKALGDQYVKDEFRRHKDVSLEQAEQFVQEWKVCFTAPPRVSCVVNILERGRDDKLTPKIQIPLF